ncbi:hypothetical protein D9619_003253 [Psilocybe cf. subviscida]|uniref:Uncharacterized protein n=1 Tax=Psilocybe cf. subviscida TaxID=2480587 RepID=A0A8H5AX73_9AGAR|nr:hypothetical protein D9619_003253 [Psilocybe cf. subviscida]
MSDPPKVKKVLLYDVQWMDDTFVSRAITESLFSPQRESGNLSAHDYDASINFFSNFHRHYPIIGTLAAVSLFPLVNNAKRTRGKQLALLFGLGVVGHGSGRLYSGVAHLNYVRSLDHPYGFQKAIREVSTQVGAPKTGRRLVLQWPYQVSPDDIDPDEQNTTSSNLILDINSESQQAKGPQVSNPRSKWDEIRNANSGTARNSTWDAIRQKHERTSTKESSKKDETLWIDNPTGQTDRYATPDTYDKGDKYSDGTEARSTS